MGRFDDMGEGESESVKICCCPHGKVGRGEFPPCIQCFGDRIINEFFENKNMTTRNKEMKAFCKNLVKQIAQEVKENMDDEDAPGIW